MTRTQYLPALFATTLLVSGCASQRPEMRAMSQSANPSAVIAAEIAFNRLAQEKGQWTAFRETAAKDAVMFAPDPNRALEWLKDKADPPKSVKWQPHKAFMSCDGKTGVTTGAWQRPDGSVGYFTTVWQWQDKGSRPADAPASYMGDGEWKWVVDHGDALTAPRAAPELIETRVASCKGKPNAPLAAPPMGAKMKMGLSRDQSLNFTWTVLPDNSRTVTVRLWNGEAFDTVIDDAVAAPAA
ncbi:hypothetical protein DXH95_11465 [Sphingorhabdus pulchriflava]|uniref:DUF4440 domain-containing protein n=1 Tax=Sphingorhabdus pulchriflava TaxID=2292257 RepID=A0A371B4V8_9SPHN|nr:hypothetical protein [Sphingorhabdus pulchriflava]RDV02574.1 hypothetical protein DXH95_11465 [Sphingorhabdus pulchriflava]